MRGMTEEETSLSKLWRPCHGVTKNTAKALARRTSVADGAGPLNNPVVVHGGGQQIADQDEAARYRIGIRGGHCRNHDAATIEIARWLRAGALRKHRSRVGYINEARLGKARSGWRAKDGNMVTDGVEATRTMRRSPGSKIEKGGRSRFRRARGLRKSTDVLTQLSDGP